LLNVGSTAIMGEYIYAATTDGGLRRAIVDNDNIIDFNNWQTIQVGSFESIRSFSNALFLQEGNRILRSTNGTTYQTFEQFSQNIIEVRASEDFLNITFSNSVRLFDLTSNQVGSFSNVDGFVANYTSSIIVNDTIFLGTRGDGVAQLGGSVWTVFGDYDVFYNPFDPDLKSEGISHFIEGEGWENIEAEEFFDATDISYVTIDPEDPERIFVSSFFSGLIEVIDSVPAILYDENNSSLEDLVRSDGFIGDVRVGDSAFDRDGNLWVLNSRVAVGLHRVTPGGQFTGFNTEDVISTSDTNLDNIVIASDGNIFIGTDDTGVLAFNPETNNFVTLSGADGAANLPIDDIRSLANEIVFLEDGIAQELLNDQVVTDIVVDGANNKWYKQLQ